MDEILHRNRQPFTPPYTREDIPQLDSLMVMLGLGREWLFSTMRIRLQTRPGFTLPQPESVNQQNIQINNGTPAPQVGPKYIVQVNDNNPYPRRGIQIGDNNTQINNDF